MNIELTQHIAGGHNTTAIYIGIATRLRVFRDTFVAPLTSREGVIELCQNR